MADLIEVADVETALGRTLTTEETARVEQLISQVSAYIESRTGIAFAPFEDLEIRCQATNHGTVELAPGPVSEITSVTDFNSTTFLQNVWQWDGLTTIFNLYPCQVVDVVYSGGMAEVPADIAGVCLDGVLRKFSQAPGGESSGPLKKKMVGGVSYEYSDTGGMFSDDSLAVLELYCDEAEYGTLYVSERHFPSADPTRGLPTL